MCTGKTSFANIWKAPWSTVLTNPDHPATSILTSRPSTLRAQFRRRTSGTNHEASEVKAEPVGPGKRPAWDPLFASWLSPELASRPLPLPTRRPDYSPELCLMDAIVSSLEQVRDISSRNLTVYLWAFSPLALWISSDKLVDRKYQVSVLVYGFFEEDLFVHESRSKFLQCRLWFLALALISVVNSWGMIDFVDFWAGDLSLWWLYHFVCSTGTPDSLHFVTNLVFFYCNFILLQERILHLQTSWFPRSGYYPFFKNWC